MNDTDNTSEATPAEGVRGPLEQEQARLTGQLRELAADEGALDWDDSFADRGELTAESNETRSLAATLRDQLDDVEKALARLDDGTYGRCEVCGDDIAEARLEAVPTARTCIRHAVG
jgi:RNA polymerase-binding transcription factor DksA